MHGARQLLEDADEYLFRDGDARFRESLCDGNTYLSLVILVRAEIEYPSDSVAAEKPVIDPEDALLSIVRDGSSCPVVTDALRCPMAPEFPFDEIAKNPVQPSFGAVTLTIGDVVECEEVGFLMTLAGVDPPQVFGD